MDRRSARHRIVGTPQTAGTIHPVPRSTVTLGSGAAATASTATGIADLMQREDGRAARRAASERRLTPPPSLD
jgi:hypothetical protein